MKRRYRTGNIEVRDGKYRARIRRGGEKVTLGTFATRSDAERALARHAETTERRWFHDASTADIKAEVDALVAELVRRAQRALDA